MKRKVNKPELLAPAGNILSAVVALDSGADAVYIGLDKFNARERADNFTIEDASKLINYAHANNKKVYITLNTLIKESELDDVAEMLTDLVELTPDAVIVQDIGIVYMIREFFPSLTIHASTQMAIHNSAGVKIAKKMGISRVILERQVMTSELQEIMRTAQIEIEVFIQGALCASLSARCLFSSWVGAWSGNRGKCTQPCRRRFYSDSGNGFFFSTKDLATLELIPKLKKMGISSLKIEGRLKKPDYIRNVVTAYRKMIDVEPEKEKIALKEAKDILKRVAGRENSAGFSSKTALNELIESKKMGVTGIYCGKVTQTMAQGFMAQVTKKIHVGDILRLQEYAGDDSSALSVSTIVINGKPVEKALKGEKCFIKCDRRVPENAAIYKTGESYARIPAKLASLTPQRQRVDLTITIDSHGCKVKSDFSQWEKSIAIENANKHPLESDKIIDAFKSSNSELLMAGTIETKIDGNLFIPASLLKQIRREAWSYIDEQFPTDMLEKRRSKLIENYHNKSKSLKNDAKTMQKQFNQSLFNKSTQCGRDTLEIDDYNGKVSEVILPPFCAENQLHKLSKKIKKIASENPNIIFRITSLYAFELIKNIDNTIIVSFPLPVCNSLAVCELSNIYKKSKSSTISKNLNNKLRTPQIETIQAWIELEKIELCNLIENSSVPIEIFTDGQVPLLVTRAEIPVSGSIHDDRGAGYIIEKNNESGVTYLYSDKALKIPQLPNTASYSTCRRHISGNKSTKFNFERELL